MTKAQLVITADTREGRYVSRLYDRVHAEALVETIRMAMRVDGKDEAQATVNIDTFAIGGGSVTLRGKLINAVELIPIEDKHTASWRPGPDHQETP